MKEAQCIYNEKQQIYRKSIYKTTTQIQVHHSTKTYKNKTKKIQKHHIKIANTSNITKHIKHTATQKTQIAKTTTQNNKPNQKHNNSNQQGT